ncbi:MAG: hypothetical protein ACJA0V_001997, partial [Planctomycetota bacterium]
MIARRNSVSRCMGTNVLRITTALCALLALASCGNEPSANAQTSTPQGGANDGGLALANGQDNPASGNL